MSINDAENDEIAKTNDDLRLDQLGDLRRRPPHLLHLLPHGEVHEGVAREVAVPEEGRVTVASGGDRKLTSLAAAPTPSTTGSRWTPGSYVFRVSQEL